MRSRPGCARSGSAPPRRREDHEEEDHAVIPAGSCCGRGVLANHAEKRLIGSPCRSVRRGRARASRSRSGDQAPGRRRGPPRRSSRRAARPPPPAEAVASAAEATSPVTASTSRATSLAGAGIVDHHQAAVGGRRAARAAARPGPAPGGRVPRTLDDAEHAGGGKGRRVMRRHPQHLAHLLDREAELGLAHAEADHLRASTVGASGAPGCRARRSLTAACPAARPPPPAAAAGVQGLLQVGVGARPPCAASRSVGSPSVEITSAGVCAMPSSRAGGAGTPARPSAAC